MRALRHPLLTFAPIDRRPRTRRPSSGAPAADAARHGGSTGWRPPTGLFERLTLWHGHFATSIQIYPGLMVNQNATQRRLGTGDFRALAQAMAVDPAMLIWLDGGGNRVGKRTRTSPASSWSSSRSGWATTPRTTRARRSGAHRVGGRRPERHRVARPPSPRPGPGDGVGQVGQRRAWWTSSSACRCRPSSSRAGSGRGCVRHPARPGDPRPPRRCLRAGHDVTALLRAAVRTPRSVIWDQ
jgi:hypothetical protein